MTTKAELDALEKVFAAEIDGRLPYQSKGKIYQRLCDNGLLAPMVREFGSGAFVVIANGYQLTHAGRLAYCVSVK